MPVRNEAGFIRRSISSLLNNDYPHSALEIVVVDGCSEDGTQDILAEIASATSLSFMMLKNEAKSTPVGMNIGIRRSSGDILMILGAHCEYASDYIRRSVEALRRTGADVVGGPWTVAAGESFSQRLIAAAWSSRFAVGDARSHFSGYEGPIDTVSYPTFRRSLLDKVGWFDEELKRNQDDEFCFRVVRAGGMIYQDPRIRLRYFPRESLAALWSQYFQYGFWKTRVIAKHGSPASWRHLVPGAFVAAVTGSLIGGAHPRGRRLPLTVLGSYVVAAAAAAVPAGFRHGPVVTAGLPFAFATMHVAYGLGFWKGIAELAMRHRAAK